MNKRSMFEVGILARCLLGLISPRRRERWFRPSYHDLVRRFASAARRGKASGLPGRKRALLFQARLCGIALACIGLAAATRIRKGWDVLTERRRKPAGRILRGLEPPGGRANLSTVPPGRGTRRRTTMDTLFHDLRTALRSLFRKPAFVATVVATLAVGIGSATVIFSLVDGVLMKPLPYPQPHRVVKAGKLSQSAGMLYAVSYPDFVDVLQRNRSFQALAASSLVRYTLQYNLQPESLLGARVSPGFFEALGVWPEHGRSFTDQEDSARAPVVVLSHGLWQRRFGGDSGVLGSTVTLEGLPLSVIGIMPSGFRPPEALSQRRAEFWMPLGFVDENLKTQRRDAFLQLVGRLRPGVSPQTADQELRSLSAQIAKEHPEAGPERTLGLASLHSQTVGAVRGTLGTLFGAVTLLLLIACVNVANLNLVRSVRRRRETALRMAVGAGRWRIVRQLLAESLMLGLAGGLAGIVLAYAGLRLFIALGPSGLPRLAEVGIDASVWAFAVSVSLLTGLFFGLLPALQSWRRDLTAALTLRTAAAAGPSQERMRNVLVVAQTALAVVLVVGAGLLINSFLRLQQVEMGFNPDNVSVMTLSYRGSEGVDGSPLFYGQLLTQVRSLPGVAAAGASAILPLSGDYMYQSLNFQGPAPLTGTQPYPVKYQQVWGDYFSALQIPLLRGRVLGEGDDNSAPLVAVINQAMAEEVFGDSDPLGRRFDLGGQGLRKGVFEIVGVVGDIRTEGLSQAAVPELYLPLAQAPRSRMHVVARTARPMPELLTQMRDQLRRLRSDLPVLRAVQMRDFASQSLAGERFYMLLLGSFAAAALSLALVGIYATLAYSVSQRRQEVGVRMAVGASRASVMAMVMGRGMVLVGLGLAGGLGASWFATRFLQSFIFEVSPTDPSTLALGSLTVIAGALAACWLPARRATQLDPVRVLRCD